MIGQGRPSSLASACARAIRVAVRLFGRQPLLAAVVVALAVCGGLPTGAAAQEPAQLDERANAPKAASMPNNTLRIEPGREMLIFSPGEQLSFELRPMLAEIAPGTAVDIHVLLSPARRNETLWSNEGERLAVPVEGQARAHIRVPLPRTEGVYTVRVSAARPSGFRERFFPAAGRHGDPLAQRSFDVVVLDPRPQRAAQTARWDSVLEIDPASARWWDRLPSWTQVRFIPGLKRGPLGSLRAGAVELPSGRFVELPPPMPGADVHWQAYSLPLEAVGVPHLLEIEYPPDQEQHFGLSIVEPNAAGVVEGIGRDGGVYVEGFGRRGALARQVHRVVFWPRTHAPLLLVTNAHPTAAARFGQIRVHKRSTPQLSTAAIGAAPGERLVAAYLARPWMAETFGASEAIATSAESPAGGATVDDWQTFFESATRLTDYLHYSGYNSAVLSVLADGSTIYPSSRLSRAPRRPTPRSAEGWTEPDGLELLLRVFDREGLHLVPAVQFASPLPELEALRRGSDPQTSGLEWVGPDGRTWLATYGDRRGEDGLGAHYNLLEPRVQQAMLRVVGELLERYGQHRALAGLAVQLSAGGYAQLPPLDWGLDDATVVRFERDTGIELAAAGPDRFAVRHALLTGTHADAWRSWRAARVTEFYAQLAALVRKTSDQRRLLITMEDTFAHPLLAARVRPNLLAENRVKSTLLDLGIDRASLDAVPGVVLCPTRFVGPTVPLRDRAADLEINQAARTWHRELTPGSTPAALLYHRPQRRRLASFAAQSPFQLAGEPDFVRQSLTHGAAVRKPYVQTLLDHDPAVLVDGGELLPLGQEDVLRPLRMILRQLPTKAEVSESAAQPVFVRTYAGATGVTLLVVNASPWHVEAEVTLDVPQATTLEPLTDRLVRGSPDPAPPAGEVEKPAPNSKAPRALAAGQQPWLLKLEPYAVEAVRIAAAGVRVTSVRAEPSDEAKAELTERLAELANRDLTAPRSYAGLRNGGFEPIGGAGPLPGWRLIVNPDTAAELDATSPHEGRTCLYLHSSGQSVAVESDAFPTPATGQLAMTVYARGQQVGPDTALRMVFESEGAGQVYRRTAPLNAEQLDDQWVQFAIHVNDLPLESGGQMRVRFELTGPGEVWLDNAALYDLLFPLAWYRESNGGAEIDRLVILIHAAKSAFDKGALADCVRLLEGYWPRFLAAHTPLVEPAIAKEGTPPPQPSSSPPAHQQQEPAPSIGERIKRMVPLLR